MRILFALDEDDGTEVNYNSNGGGGATDMDRTVGFAPTNHSMIFLNKEWLNGCA